MLEVYKCWHPVYRLQYAIVNLRIGENKVLTCREKIIKREGEGGRERAANTWGDHDTDQRAKAVVTLAIVGKRRVAL